MAPDPSKTHLLGLATCQPRKHAIYRQPRWAPAAQPGGLLSGSWPRPGPGPGSGSCSGLYALAPGVTVGRGRAWGAWSAAWSHLSSWRRVCIITIFNIYLASKARPDQVVFIRMRPCFSAQFRRGNPAFSLQIAFALFANWTRFVNTGK